MSKKISLIGAAIDACGNKRGAFNTPDNVKTLLQQLGLSFDHIFRYEGDGHDIANLTDFFSQIANQTKNALINGEFPIVVGGDHSCAIGTWSGISHQINEQNKTLGLIWIDAHMDAHTPDTTLTGNIHGMPVATILGHGYSQFLSILNDDNPKINPENIILIGVRSFEEAEAYLLKKLGVEVYDNYAVGREGFECIFTNSWEKLNKQVDKIGLSIDLDGFDPEFAPGVSTPEPDGVDFNEFLACLEKLDFDKLIGVEIAEGNANVDPTGKTMQCIADIIAKIKTDT